VTDPHGQGEGKDEVDQRSISAGQHAQEPATRTMMIAVTITHDPNIDTIVLQLAAMPVASATTMARLATSTSSGCHVLACSVFGVLGVARAGEQAGQQRQEHEEQKTPDDVPGADRRTGHDLPAHSGTATMLTRWSTTTTDTARGRSARRAS
jgi:hypothetical protein